MKKSTLTLKPVYHTFISGAFVTKDHTSNGVKYDYKVLFDNADQFETFFISANFNKDLNIGFSASGGHNDKKWEILNGGWDGTRSVIRSNNQTPHRGLVVKTFTPAVWHDFKRDLQVLIKSKSYFFFIKKYQVKY